MDSSNQTLVGDMVGPIDLSKKSTAPDIIMLSDSDDDLIKCKGDVVDERKVLIKKLTEDLRNEEAKLVLLKKLRHSQRSGQRSPETPPNTTKTTSSTRTTSSTGPPPLVRGSVNPSQKSANTSNSHVSVLRTPAHVPNSRPQQPAHQPPPLVMAPGRGGQSGQPRSNNLSQTSLIHGFSRQSGAQVQSSSQHHMRDIDSQTPSQRQAAAKLALRKQLEKTLLQIPPPKPPPPEMNFIPSLATNEFIMCVGLEEVVKTITDLDSNARGFKSSDVKYVFNPFTCVQCDTDFTPVWKRDKPGSKNVICEACVTTNQKKALKQEHTNRLKSAFVKALQQEQEIEQRMQSQPSMSANQNNVPASSTVNLCPTFKPSKSTSAAMQITHQNLLQAHAVQQQLQSSQAVAAAAALGLSGFNPRMTGGFPFSFTKPGEIPRQFLLDMMPTRGAPPGSANWKN